jgi:catechol-2,3-dioxygenase
MDGSEGREGAAPRVRGLGHIGLYVRDVERMSRFYQDVMGLVVTKRDPGGRAVFLSTDPAASDHEIVVMAGRPSGEDPHLIQQISWRLASLADLRRFHARLVGEGYRIDRVLNHGSAVGCYFFDPEGNRTEVFWRQPDDCWVPTGEPVDLATMDDSAILAAMARAVERARDVPMGAVREGAAEKASDISAMFASAPQ